MPRIAGKGNGGGYRADSKDVIASGTDPLVRKILAQTLGCFLGQELVLSKDKAGKSRSS